LHDWIGDSWAVLFSHPKDFTPVCTTELGYMAKIKPEFDKRNTKIIGPSVDPTGKHEQWADDIARQLFGSWREPRPYIRIVPEPTENGTPR
jgi:alkyl hydroperoxide reductase subunit AhpC